MKNRDKKGRFILGHSTPNKIRQKISNTLKGRHCSPKTEFSSNTIINGMTLSESRKRENLSKKTRRKLSISKIGNTCNFGHKHTKKHKKMMSKLYTGKGNPNWQDGASFKPYCYKFNEELKELIRERDNYTCQRCGKAQKVEVKDYNRKLCVHHIHFDKENCYPDLISLCNKCHLIVNHKRISSERKFMKNLKERNLLNWSY